VLKGFGGQRSIGERQQPMMQLAPSLMDYNKIKPDLAYNMHYRILRFQRRDQEN